MALTVPTTDDFIDGGRPRNRTVRTIRRCPAMGLSGAAHSARKPSRMAIDARLSTRTARCGAADLADLVKYLHSGSRGIGLMVDLSINRM